MAAASGRRPSVLGPGCYRYGSPQPASLAAATAAARLPAVCFVQQQKQPSNSALQGRPPYQQLVVQQHQQEALFPQLQDSQQQLLCDALGVSAQDAQLLLLSCPSASTMSHAQLQDSCTQLRQLLPVPQPLLLQALLQLPELLPQPQAVITARLAEAAELLGVPLARLVGRQAGRTVELHWRLLVTPRERLVTQLGCLQQQLGGVTQGFLVWLIVAEPELLSVDAASLLSSIEALEQVCSCPLARLLPQLRRQPRVLVRPAGVLYEAAAKLQQLLRLSEEGLALVLRRCPAALLVSSTRLGGLLEQLSARLRVGPEVAADILLQEPELLVRSPGAVSAVLDVLASTFKLEADGLMQVIQFDPSILGFPPGPLAQNTRQFKQLAGSCRPWAAECKHLMSRPVNVARALRVEPLRLQRLVFLSRQGLSNTIGLRAALTLSGRKFVGLYPHYTRWLQDNYSAGNAPLRYRVGPGSDAYNSYGEDSDGEEDRRGY